MATIQKWMNIMEMKMDNEHKYKKIILTQTPNDAPKWKKNGSHPNGSTESNEK